MITGGCWAGAGCCTTVVGGGCVAATFGSVAGWLLIQNRTSIVINAIATTTSTPTMPAEMPLLSGVRTDCECTTSRLSFGVSTTTRLRLACSSSYAIITLRYSIQFIEILISQIRFVTTARLAV